MEAIKQEHKKQLHDRIEERTVELKASLKALQSDPANAKSERARAVEEALAALTTHLSGGWDKVDEGESAALTRWLETSRFLFDSKPPAVKLVPDAPKAPVEAKPIAGATPASEATPVLEIKATIDVVPAVYESQKS